MVLLYTASVYYTHGRQVWWNSFRFFFFRKNANSFCFSTYSLFYVILNSSTVFPWPPANKLKIKYNLYLRYYIKFSLPTFFVNLITYTEIWSVWQNRLKHTYTPTVLPDSTINFPQQLFKNLIHVYHCFFYNCFQIQNHG